MPGPVCKAIICSGAVVAGGQAVGTIAASLAHAVEHAVDVGAILPDDRRIAAINSKLTECGEELTQMAGELHALGVDFALNASSSKGAAK